MIVFKYTYDTSVGEFTPTFNSGYVYTTKTSTSGTLKTVTIESDTAFTGLSWGSSSKSSITKIDLVDVSGLKSLAQVFYDFTSLTSVTVVNATTGLLDINHAFYGNTALTDITLVDCDFTAVDNMRNCFNGGANSSAVNVKFSNVKFNNVSKGMIFGLRVATNMKIENCDFSKTTNMHDAFADCVGLTGTLDLSTTPFSPNVTDMSTMFSGCKNLTKIIMPKGDFPLLTNMNALCFRCSNLKEIDFSNFSAKGASISFSQTFGECPVLEEIDLSSLGAIATNCHQIAYGNPNITYSLRKVNLSGLKITSSVDFNHAFYGISTIEWIDISNFHATPSIVTNFSFSKDTIKNIGALYCPANVINYYANLLVNSGNVCNIYYHDAKLEDLTVDSRFNYIYCEEYHGSEVSTPDDLKLYCNHHYDRTTKISSPCNQDTLDLTTGTITRKNIKARLNDCIAKLSRFGCALVTVNGGDMVRVRYDHTNSSSGIFPVQIDGEVIGTSATGIVFSASQGGYDGRWNPTGDIEHAYTDPNTIFMFFNPSRFDGIDYTDSETIKNWLIEQDFTLIIKIQNASVYTEQLPTSLNPLKSYYNGSIQTSSQQLVPTLKTTLPVSNKFTTTNLTSGLTYNVYFDGTATKLDAGGTIITDPVSPCEVEYGGTTLTIEGADIQNVRVLETINKNEVCSVNGTTDVELKKIKTYKYENVLDDITYKTSVWNGAVINIDYDDFCIEFMGAHGWSGEFADTGLKYPTGCSLVHVEFDIDMDNPNLRMAINFNEGIYNSYPQHRHVTLNNDTATIAQGNYENIYTSIITKGHFSRLMYANGDRPIIINLYTGSYIAGILATGNSAEGSIDGYETIGSNYARITNLRMRIIENFSSNYTTVTSVLRDSSYNIIWQDMDMTMPVATSKLEQPIKLRSLGTTYDSYNPVTGELVKRIGVSETDGSYSVLSSPIVIPSNYKMLQDNNIILDSFPQVMNSGYVDFLPTQLLPNTTYTVFLDATTASGQLECGLLYNADWYDGVKSFTVGVNRFIYTTGNDINGYYSNTSHRGFRIRGQGSIINNLIMVQGEYSLDFYNPINVPHLYTNGQVKVYSDSEVYPTTILNGQSTNNYEVNELNKSNNYTIRYDGECESIILNGKSNEQGTNRIVKTSTDGSGNLTFVNDSGDINNVLLVQNDVREQEINHFNGLQTVEVSGMLIENQGNMWWNDWIAPSQYGASWQVDSPEFISVQPGETIYVVANNNNYTSLLEFDENYNIVNQGKDLILSNEANPKPVNLGNNYYKNYRVLSENTRYIKFTIPAGTASAAKSETRWSVISFTKADVGNVPLYTNNTPYRGSIINLPQPVQLNSLPDGTCDTYNPITGEYVQRVGYFVLDDTFASCWRIVKTKDGKPVAQRDLSTQAPHYNTLVKDYSFPDALYDYQTGTKAIANIPLVYSIDHTSLNVVTPSLYGDTYFGNHFIRIALPFTPNDLDQWNYSYTQVNDWLRENPIHIAYKRTEPITTQLTPIEIPTFEGGILQLITTDGKVFPMVEYSMPTNNRYDTSSWETGAVYTQRNMTEAYFNESTTPMIPTETMTLTTDHISSGSIILNDNGNGLIVLKGNYTGRDIPYFTGMRSVESIEVEVTPSPDQPLFGKGGRK